MTDEQLAEMHKLLAEYHRGLARDAALDVVQQYHADLAQRLADEAALIPRRTAIAQRLREGEQQKRNEMEGTAPAARLTCPTPCPFRERQSRRIIPPHHAMGADDPREPS